LFSYRLAKKDPVILKTSKGLKLWVSLERSKRVLRDGLWSKKKTGKKIPRRIHVNNKKLLPATRKYIFATRKRGFTVDITNSLLSFFKFYSQMRFHRRKLRAFLHASFSNILAYLPMVTSLQKYYRKSLILRFKPSFSSAKTLYSFLMQKQSRFLMHSFTTL
jgi:hypothetical protein